MHISHPPVLRIQEHCSALSKLLPNLDYLRPTSVVNDGELVGWAHPAEWLDLAASVTKMEVVTGQDDQSLGLCESALDDEEERSALLSQFVTSLTVFSFTWGAFESAAKIVSPPAIPKALRNKGNNSLTARVVHALKSVTPDGVYYCALASLCRLLRRSHACHASVPTELAAITNADAGLGLGLVRVIRNGFAHGAASLPQLDGSDSTDSLDSLVVRISSRIVLLTIQMILREFYRNQSFEIEIFSWRTESGTECWEIHRLLETIHLAEEASAE